LVFWLWLVPRKEGGLEIGKYNNLTLLWLYYFIIGIGTLGLGLPSVHPLPTTQTQPSEVDDDKPTNELLGLMMMRRALTSQKT
jgi:hypothetical protein